MQLSSQHPAAPAQQQCTTCAHEGGQSDKEEIKWWQQPIPILTLAMVLVGAAQAVLFLVQLRLIRESLTDAEKGVKAAQDAATAAKTQAEAIMAAEGAHLYAILKADTVKSIFQAAGMYDNSLTMHDSEMNGPGLQYVLRNYGKSPAILQQCWHGISLQKEPDTIAERDITLAHMTLEIIGVDAESAAQTVSYLKPFKFGDARALVLRQKFLCFYGKATYINTFGDWITLEWEFVAEHGVFRQTKHQESRKKPDA